MRRRPSGDMIARLTKSGYVITSRGSGVSDASRPPRSTSVTVQSLLAKTATGDVYAAWARPVVGGNHKVMQLTRSFASL